MAIPQALFSLFFGRLADRVDRRALCLCCDLVSAGAALALPAWLLLGGPLQLAAYSANFALAFINALFVPVSNALIKERVRPDRLARFNARYEMAFQAGTLLSTAAGGALIQLFGVEPLFFLNAATFLGSATCIFALGPRPPAARTRSEAERAGQPSTHPPMVPLGLLYALGHPVITVSNTLLVVLVIQVFRQQPGILGVVDAVAGGGFLLAAALYKRLSAHATDLRIALLGFAGCAAFITAQPLFGVALLMVLLPLGTLTFGAARIATRTMLMAAVEESRAGQVFGAANATGLALSVAATLGISVIADSTEVRYGFLALALLIIVVAVPNIAALRDRGTDRLPAQPPAEEEFLLEPTDVTRRA